MGNKEEWDELEKWKLEKELKEKDKYSIKIKEFNKENYKHIDYFFKLFKFAIKWLIILAIIWVIGLNKVGQAIIIKGIEIYHNIYPINIEEKLSEKYNGQEFITVEDKTKEVKGLYIKSPLNNYGIKFSCLETNTTFKEDYSANRLKYYMDNYENNNQITNLKIEESYNLDQNVNFLNYNIYFDVTSYKELNDSIVNAYNFITYVKNKDNYIDNIIYIRDVKRGFYKEIKCNEIGTLDEELYSIKYAYIKLLDQNKDENAISEIPNEDKVAIWRPSSLRINLNGKYFMDGNLNDVKAKYNEYKKYYMINDTVESLLKNISQVQITETDYFTSTVRKIKYNNKEYEIDYNSVPNRNDYSKVYAGGSIEDFLSVFNHELKYDYDNETVYIKIY